MRFRVRPPKNRELPLQLKAQIIVTGTRVLAKCKFRQETKLTKQIFRLN